MYCMMHQISTGIPYCQHQHKVQEPVPPQKTDISASREETAACSKLRPEAKRAPVPQITVPSSTFSEM